MPKDNLVAKVTSLRYQRITHGGGGLLPKENVKLFTVTTSSFI